MRSRQLAGDLTLERWIIWNELTVDQQSDPRLHFDRTQDPELRDAYEILKKSDFFFKNFLQLPYTLQDRVRHAAVLSESLGSNEAYAMLYLKLRDMNHSLAGVFEDATDSVYQKTYERYVSNLSTEDHSRFYAAEYELTLYSYEPMLDETILLVLIAIYGWNHALEMVETWNSNKVTHDLSWLVKLIERWDEFKIYPVDWALNLLGATN